MTAAPYRHRPSLKGSPGFTLLETLVALAVAGLVLSLLAAMTSQFSNAARRVEAASRRIEDGDACSRILRLLLANVPMEMQQSAQPSVSGGPAGMTVFTLGPAILGLTSEAMFKVRYEPDATSPTHLGRLLLEWPDARTGRIRQETIAEHMSSLTLGYKRKGADAAWQSTWSGPVSALQFVRLDASFVEGGSAGATQALIAVSPILPQICVIDPLHQNCPSW